jgi:hypothetical protein
MNPGMRKVAGETLLDALIPLQPVPTRISMGTHSSRRDIRFKLILAV